MTSVSPYDTLVFEGVQANSRRVNDMATFRSRKTSKGENRYQALVRMKGFPKEVKTFNRLTDAKEWARQTEADMKAGRYIPMAQAKKHTIKDMLTRYKEQILPRKPRSRKQQAPHADWWIDQIGHYSLAEATPSLIIEHRNALERKTSASTANRYAALLSHAFTIAIKEWGWMDDNPFRKISRLKEPKGRVRCLSDDERDALLKACQENGNPNLYPVVVLALSTGCRKQEMLNLQWGDVDLERELFTIHDTKNGERRSVPLKGLALEILKEHKRTRRRIDCNFVFPAPTKPKPADIDRDFAQARDTAQIQDFHFHDLRHTAASYFAMNGASLADIATVLGHKTLSMAQRYTHLSESYTSTVVASMNDKIFGSQEHPSTANGQ